MEEKEGLLHCEHSLDNALDETKSPLRQCVDVAASGTRSFLLRSFSFDQPYVFALLKGHTVKDGTRIQNYTKPQADSVIPFLVLFFALQRPSACHVCGTECS